MSVTVALEPGRFDAAVRDRLEQWERDRLAQRLWAKDPTIWFADATDGITDRLGWLDLPRRIGDMVPDPRSFGEGLTDEGIANAAVLGMGGSSLSVAVFEATLGDPAIPVMVVDSTHPDAVAAASDALPRGDTLFIVSSKSGTTLETLSLFRYFWERERGKGSPGSRFVTITDPGSPLERLATDRGFRAVFRAPPDVGGRYSALSEFGLVPAAVAGFDLTRLQRSSVEAMSSCGPEVPPGDNPALLLGALLGEAAIAGVDKAALITSPSIRPIVSWIEQLIAESTGKSGTGIIPVPGDGPSAGIGFDRAVLSVTLDGEQTPALPQGHPTAHVEIGRVADIAGLMFVLEMAIAVAGEVLRIHPFDQPDVQAAKDHARAAMDATGSIERPGSVRVEDPHLSLRLGDWLRGAEPPAYAAIHAYLPPTSATTTALRAMRGTIERGHGVATTADFGPRFLHSTGQLHKGGPPTGRFLQIIDAPTQDIAVPETDYTFGRLIAAQADGDHRALTERDRPVLRVDLGDAGGRGLATLLAALDAAASQT